MTRLHRNSATAGALMLALTGIVATAESPLGTAFTYQGELQEMDTPVNAACDFAFSLWDDATAGNQIGTTLNKGVDVVDGQFSEMLDFGSAFTGSARWLQIEVCCPSGCAPGYTVLDPRQELTPAPNALRAANGVGGPDALNVANFGRVGIGMSIPDAKLDVSFSVPNGRVLRANCAAFGGSFEVRDFEAGAQGQLVGIWEGNAAGPIVRYRGAGAGTDFVDVGQHASGGYVVETNDVPRMTVQLDGNIGMGTEAPTAALDIRKPGAPGKGQLVLVDPDNPSTDDAAVTAISAFGSDIGASGAGRMWYLGSRNAATKELALQNTVGDTLRFGVNGMVSDLVITPTGTSLVADLTVAGQGFKPGGGFWAVLSDRRLKKNIEALDGALERLMRLRGVTFEYKDPQQELTLPGRQTGMIAQEVEEVFPEWVSQTEDGHKYIAIHGLTALTVEALRDLRQEKDDQIADLRAMNTQLEARIDRLELLIAKSRNNEGGGR